MRVQPPLCVCSLFLGRFVLVFRSFPVSLQHEGKGYRLLRLLDSTSLFFLLSHASSFSRAMRRRILLLVPFPQWKPARLFPSLTPSISVFLLSHLTTPLASERYVTYIVGYPSFARAIVGEYSFVTIGQRRIFDDYYRSYTIKVRSIWCMAVCTFVLLITVTGPQCSRQSNFRESICSRSGASTLHPCHEPRKFLSMSMNPPDNGRLMIIGSTHFEATDDRLLPFSRFNIFDLVRCSKLPATRFQQFSFLS